MGGQGTDVEQDILDSPEAGGVLIRGSAIRLVSYGGALLASLVSVPFMTRHLGEIDYGYYVTVSSLLFIFVGMTEAGLTQLGTREYSHRGRDERERFLRHLVGLRIVLSVSGLLLAIAFVVATQRPSPVIAGTAIMGVGMLFFLTQQTYTVKLNAELRLGWVSALELARQLVLSGTIIVLVIAGAGVVWFFGATVASGIVVLALTLVVVRGDALLRPAWDRREAVAIMRVMLPYALAAAVGLVYFRLALVLLGFVGTDTEVGTYSAAFRAIEALGGVPWVAVSAAFPILARAARDDTARLSYGSRRVFDIACLAGGLLSLTIFVTAPFIIAVLGGKQFADAVPVLQILSFSLLTTFIVAGATFSLLAIERFREILLANALAVGVSAALTLALVPSLGAEGAAVATLAAEIVLASAYLFILRLHDPAMAPGPMPIIRLLPAAAAMLAIAAVIAVHPLIEAAIGGAAFLVVAYLLGAVPPELLDALRRRAPATNEEAT